MPVDSSHPPTGRGDPYHSARRSQPHVHHLFAECLAGRLIPDRNRREGTHGWPLCKSCKALQPAGGIDPLGKVPQGTLAAVR
jgi:hypothetical protein